KVGDAADDRAGHRAVAQDLRVDVVGRAPVVHRVQFVQLPLLEVAVGVEVVAEDQAGVRVVAADGEELDLVGPALVDDRGRDLEVGRRGVEQGGVDRHVERAGVEVVDVDAGQLVVDRQAGDGDAGGLDEQLEVRRYVALDVEQVTQRGERVAGVGEALLDVL